MIKITELNKTFTEKKHNIQALKNVSLTLPEKGMIFIIGKSGSGKSTLLNMIAGFSKPTSGKIFFDGEDIISWNDRRLDRYHEEEISFIFQNYSILEDLTVAENVALGRKENPKRLEKEIDDILQKVLLVKAKNKKAKYLSGGEKQRVAIARALIRTPKAIFADEPTGNLDRNSSREVLDLLKEYSKQALVLIVSHNLFDAYEYGDRIITLNQGEIIEDKSLRKDKEKEDIYYISRDTFLKKEEMEKLNSFLFLDNPPLIKSNKEAYEDSKEIDETPSSKKETNKTKSSFLHSFLPVMKTINSKKGKTILFTLLIPIILTLLSCMNSLRTYDVKKLTENDSYFQTSDTYLLGKAQEISFVQSEYEMLRPTYFDAIDEEDDAKLSSLPEEERPYKLFNFTHMFSLKANDYLSSSEFHSKIDKIDFNHCSSTNGLLLCNDEFIKKNLRLDEIQFLEKRA